MGRLQKLWLLLGKRQAGQDEQQVVAAAVLGSPACTRHDGGGAPRFRPRARKGWISAGKVGVWEVGVASSQR